MKKQLLDRAKTLGFNVYQNGFGQWVIRGMIDQKMWVLREQRPNSWLMTFDRFAPLSLGTKKSLKALNLLSKDPATNLKRNTLVETSC